MAKVASWRGASAGALLALAVTGCVGNIGADPSGSSGPSGPQGTAGASPTGSAGAGSPTGSAGTTGTGGAGSPVGVGGSAVTGTGGTGSTLQCNSIAPGRSPMRRLTTYEYNNTIRDLLGDTTNPGSALPAQVDSKQNPFGNDADEQSPQRRARREIPDRRGGDRRARDRERDRAHQAAQLRDQRHRGQRGVVRPHDRDLAGAARSPAHGRDDRDRRAGHALPRRARPVDDDHIRLGRGGDDRRAAAIAGVPLSRGARHGGQPATRR